MSVRVIRVGSIPFGLSVLVDKRPGSVVVWLLESEWPDSATVGLLEQVLTAVYAAEGELATAVPPGLRAI